MNKNMESKHTQWEILLPLESNNCPHRNYYYGPDGDYHYCYYKPFLPRENTTCIKENCPFKEELK